IDRFRDSFSTWQTMKTNLLLAAQTIWLANLIGASAPAVETGVVLENRVNIRSQPALSSEVIAQLREGDLVTILDEVPADKIKPGEPEKWMRISLPTNIHVWVHTQFIDPNSKTVLPRRLNVRSGPGENHSVVGRLEQGAVVNETSRKDNWMEID